MLAKGLQTAEVQSPTSLSFDVLKVALDVLLETYADNLPVEKEVMIRA